MNSSPDPVPAHGMPPDTAGVGERDCNGYIVVERNGYRMRRVAADKTYRYEHRLVMEWALGRTLASHEIVHHLNHDRHDNRPENLQVLQGHAEHRRAHPSPWPKGKPKPWQCKPLVPCPVCGVMFKPKRRTTPQGRQDTRTCSQQCGQTFRQAEAGGRDPRMAKVPEICHVCGRTFSKVRNRAKRTCSRRCGQAYRAKVYAEHGMARYRRGCRCETCRAANAAKGRTYRATVRQRGAPC